MGVAPKGVVTPPSICGVCWGPAPVLAAEGATPLELVPLPAPAALEGTGCCKLLLDTLLDSLELEVWQDAEVGVANVTQG